MTDDVARTVERIDEQWKYVSGQINALTMVTAQILSVLVQNDHHARGTLADGIRVTAEAISDSRGDVSRPSDVAITGLLHTMREISDKLARDSDRGSVSHDTASG